MDSETIEIRAISRAVAVLGAIVGALLLSQIELQLSAAPGADGDVSIEVVRKRPEAATAATNAALAPTLAATAARQVVSANLGAGADIRLWRYGPAGEIVFVNADRYTRCVAARAGGREEADCPSAADRRRMVLDPERA